MNKNYFPLVSKPTKRTFFNYIECIDLPEIDYFAIGVQNPITKKSMSIMSLPEWQKHFSSHDYAEFDPLRKATLNTSRNLILFSEIDFADNFGKEIMHQRKNHGITNGIVMMQRFDKYNYMLTLGTGFSNFDPYSFLKKRYKGLMRLKRDFIKIIENDAQNFLSSTLNK